MISLNQWVLITSLLATSVFTSVAGADATTTVLEDQGLYVCHPPMEQLLVGRDDLSTSTIFNSAKSWADAALTNISVSVDSVSLSVFGPSGAPIYQNRMGLQRANISRSVDSNTIYRVARYRKFIKSQKRPNLRH